MEKKEFLKSVSLFSDLNDAQLEQVAGVVKEKTCKINEVIFEEGTPGDALYLVTDGSVRIAQRVTKKREALSFLRKGDFFGEMALFEDAPRSATVTAVENSAFLVFSKDDFNAVLDSSPDVAARILRAMIKIMSSRLRITDRQVRRNLILSRGYIWSSPVIVGDTIYLGSDDHFVYALDTGTGRLNWKVETGNDVCSTVCYANDMAYVGSDDHHMYALDSKSGLILWKFPTEGRVRSSPWVKGNSVFFGSEDRNIYAVDVSGKLVWKYETGDKVLSSPIVSTHYLYIGSTDHHIYALDITNGVLIWKFSTGGDILSSPTIGGETIYIGSDDSSLYALDAAGGGLRWKFKTDDKITATPAYAKGKVYVGSHDHFIYALNGENGNLL